MAALAPARTLPQHAPAMPSPTPPPSLGFVSAPALRAALVGPRPARPFVLDVRDAVSGGRWGRAGESADAWEREEEVEAGALLTPSAAAAIGEERGRRRRGDPPAAAVIAGRGRGQGGDQGGQARRARQLGKGKGKRGGGEREREESEGRPSLFFR